MDKTSQETPLKPGLHRDVCLRTDVHGARTVVKRFHSRGHWRRLGDRFRAKGEFKMLNRLRALGLRVPAALACAKRQGAWELSLAEIPGARSLSERLNPLGAGDRKFEGLDLARAARQLGSLLGQAHGLGLDHGDLHGGNLLLDPQSQAWLVDVPKARIHSKLPLETILQDLTTLEADSREFIPAGLRHRFWLAWKAAFLAERGTLPPELKLLAQGIKNSAITQRREALLQHANRWLRVSGLCERRDYQGRPVLAARHELAQAWFKGPGLAAVFDQGHPMVEPSWTTVGRAWQHGLPSLIPLFVRRGPEPMAAYLLPEQAATLGFQLSQDDRPLATALASRGLAMSAKSQSVHSKENLPLLGPGCRLIFTELMPHG
jgi:tRNA A-37 threonylcarbamoyl transferase component Bud32